MARKAVAAARRAFDATQWSTDADLRADLAELAERTGPHVDLQLELDREVPQEVSRSALRLVQEAVAAVAAAAPELVRELVVIDITPGISPNGGAAQLREFFAGPTDWASRDELVDRALAFGLGGQRAAAELEGMTA